MFPMKPKQGLWRAESQSAEETRGGTLIAKVAVEAATYAIDKPYDYLVPLGLSDKVQVGIRVTVPFGRGNRTSEGIILALVRGEAGGKLKALSAVLDNESVLDEERLKLAFWMRERYFCTLYSAVRTILPEMCIRDSGDGAGCDPSRRDGEPQRIYNGNAVDRL